MNIELRYGSGSLPLTVPDWVHADIFEPQKAPLIPDPAASLRAALDNPLGCRPLKECPAPASVAIAVPDETRPFPVKSLLLPLLEKIFESWPDLSAKDIAVVVGGGLHPPADKEQIARILPADMPDCRIVAHDAKNSPMIKFGTTSRGTPVEINAAYGAADFKIVMGMVDTHQFVGFTGGAKGVVIGCASAAAIAANHKMLVDPNSAAGRIDGNPVREDLNESGRLVGIDLAVNVVLDAAKRPVIVLAGQPEAVMKAAAARTAELYGLPFTEPYDIVVASCGGHPKDICLYQAQKGLNSAMQCAAPNAKILLAAQCGQGLGDEDYHNYVKQFSNAQALKKDFEARGFKMGAHKAYLFAAATTKFEVVIKSDLSQELLKECLLAAGELQPVFDNWLEQVPNARVAVIKNANSSFFIKKDD